MRISGKFRVDRIAGSLGLRGAKTWRLLRGRWSLIKGRGRSLNPKTSITDESLGFEPNFPGPRLAMDFSSSFQEIGAIVLFERVYIHDLIHSLFCNQKSILKHQ